jgi:hypothetical protein
LWANQEIRINMTKNMTRKGLAFGAGLALVASGLAGVPAQAAGLTGYIDLTPSSGPADAFAILAGGSFSLTSQPATTVGSGGVTKFLVADDGATVEPTIGGLKDDGVAIEYPNKYQLLTATSKISVVAGAVTLETATAHGLVAGMRVEFAADVLRKSAVAANTVSIVSTDVIYTVATAPTTTTLTLTEAADVVTLGSIAGDLVTTAGGVATFNLTSGASNPFIAGDVIRFAGAVNNTAGVIFLADKDYTVATSNAGDLVVNGAEINSAGDTAVQVSRVVTAQSLAEGLVSADTQIRLVRSERAADNSYVVSSGISDGSAMSLLLTDSNTTTSKTVAVTAWIDAFPNDAISSTEYQSDAKVISFVTRADVTLNTSLTPPKVGDTALTAVITSSPKLNALEDGTAELVRTVFTRQDSSSQKMNDTAPVQNTTTGAWTDTVLLNLTDTSETWSPTAFTAAGTSAWADLLEAASIGGAVNAVAGGTLASDVVTLTFGAVHKLRVGDTVILAKATGTADTQVTAGTYKITAVPSTLTIQFATATTETTDKTLADTYSVRVNTGGTGVGLTDLVFPGDYSAVGLLQYTNTTWKTTSGAASAAGTLAAVATQTSLSTTASASVQGTTETGTGATAFIKTGTASVDVMVTVLDEDNVAVAGGRTVVGSISNRTGQVKVNNAQSSTAQTLSTDANGQVKFTVSSGTAKAGEKVTITTVAEGVAGSSSDLTIEWADAALTMADLNTSATEIANAEARVVAAGTSYVVAVQVADQFNTGVADADYRLKVSGSGVVAGFVSLVGGKANVTITDAGVSTSFDSVITLQKKNTTTGLFADTTTVKTITTATSTKAGLLVGAAGSSLYGNTVVTSVAVAKVALVERDTRVAAVATPAYVNKAVLNGKALNSSNSTALPGAVVTVSGPTSILFSNGAVDARGSVTVVADSGGLFEVNLYSVSAQSDSVITVTFAGVSKTIKVSFTGAGVGEGTSLVVTMPAAVKPASTFQVKAKLADVYGNGVNTVAGSIKVTYTGAGIVFGTLPTETDANGELMFSVLLGSNDTGSVNVTVSYDQNADLDFVDAKDLNTSGTTAITATGLVAGSSDTIVNVGTFSGKLVVYALNAAGSEVSYKIAGKWVTQVVTSDLLMRYDRVVGATGKTIKVDIYVDGVLKLAKSVVTK